MKKTRKAAIALMALVLVLVMAACSGGNGGNNGSSGNGGSGTDGGTDKPAGKKVTIEYWHTYSDAEEMVLTDKIKPAFEEAYPNIELKLTRMPYEGLKQQVIAGVAGDAAPDLMRMDIVWVPEFAAQNALMEVSKLDGFEELKGRVFEAPMATNYFNSGYYGVPVNTNTKVAIYNKATLAEAGLTEAPKTMDELVAAAETLKAKGKYGMGVSGIHAWGLAPWFWSLGGSITNDDYTKADGYLNSEASVKALQTIMDWNSKGLVLPVMLGGEPGTWDGIISGEYLMSDDGPWFYSTKIAEKEATGFDPLEETVRALMPAGDGGSRSVIGGENLVMFANSKHPEEAWTFAKWMLTEEPQKIMAETGLIPSNKAAADAMKSMDIPFVDTYVEQLETALPRTPIPQWGEVEAIFNLAFEKAIRGESEPKAALDEAVKQIEAILK
ncbi:extracellular solute-binding protein [Paenibacillus pinisoli]|uniref:Extracellular solute-binding protein n=1 Tax=Paenibacillus pinisoli TaxID=1276110 RepID=A0A3A6PGN5_9BACL|nr:extracellular solute-binding protein [Paenibacillus pinisoli]RJX38886.1 extracellular solute-binding protein [Paenibacillus pinisoli]